MKCGEKPRGRKPSQNPKDVTIRCRITRELDEKLEEYCAENNTTKSEIMIQGILNVLGQ